MPFVIIFDFSNRYGGTPVAQSKKEYFRLAPNAALIVSRVNGAAHARTADTPCLQNDADGFVTVTGPYTFYDAIVTVSGFAQPFSGTAGAGKVTGGLSWQFADDASAKQAGAVTSPNNPPMPAGAQVLVNFSYAKRLQNGVRTFLGSCSSAGGLTIKAAPGVFTAYVQQILVVSFSLQFTAGWMNVGPKLPLVGPLPAQPSTILPGANDSQPSEPQKLWDLFGSARSLVPAADDFQEPALRQALAEQAFALETEEVKASLASIRLKWTRDLKPKPPAV